MQTSTEKTRDWRALTAAVYRGFPRRRFLAALALTLLLHLAVYEASPSLLTALSRTVVPAKPAEIVRAEKFEEIPETLLPEEFRKKPQFVPVNPNAPTATPKDDANLSAADQRAAQENPDPDSRSRTPTNDGELEDSRATIEDGMNRVMLELVAVTDWNNDGVDDWLVLCRSGYSDTPRRFRENCRLAVESAVPPGVPKVELSAKPLENREP